MFVSPSKTNGKNFRIGEDEYKNALKGEVIKTFDILHDL